jgi:hypothetical protein
MEQNHLDSAKAGWDWQFMSIPECGTRTTAVSVSFRVASSNRF